MKIRFDHFIGRLSLPPLKVLDRPWRGTWASSEPGERKIWPKKKKWKIIISVLDKRNLLIFGHFRRFFQVASRCTLTNILWKSPKPEESSANKRQKIFFFFFFEENVFFLILSVSIGSMNGSTRLLLHLIRVIQGRPINEQSQTLIAILLADDVTSR